MTIPWDALAKLVQQAQLDGVIPSDQEIIDAMDRAGVPREVAQFSVSIVKQQIQRLAKSGDGEKLPQSPGRQPRIESEPVVLDEVVVEAEAAPLRREQNTLALLGIGIAILLSMGS